MDLLRVLGDLARARALAEEAVAECTAVLGAAHANTLEAQHGLASHRR